MNSKKLEKAKLPSVARRYEEDEVLDIIYKCQGVRTTICNELDCTLQQFNVYLRSHPEMKLDLIAARQALIDLAEDVIKKNLTSENEMVRQKAAEFTLKSLGRNEGWCPENVNAMQINVASDNNDTKVQINSIFGIQ